MRETARLAKYHFTIGIVLYFLFEAFKKIGNFINKGKKTLEQIKNMLDEIDDIDLEEIKKYHAAVAPKLEKKVIYSFDFINFKRLRTSKFRWEIFCLTIGEFCFLLVAISGPTKMTILLFIY